MKPLTYCMSAIVLLVASAAAYADAKSDAAARAKAVAPFVEAETAIVAHVDLTRVDPSAAVDFAARTTYPTPPPNEIAEAKKEATKGLQGHSSRRQGVLRGRHARQPRLDAEGVRGRSHAGRRRCGGLPQGFAPSVGRAEWLTARSSSTRTLSGRPANFLIAERSRSTSSSPSRDRNL